jgi:hypothetical protein
MSGINPLYRITIIGYSPNGVQGAGNHVIVEAPMPESFKFDTQSAYAPMLPQGVTSGSVATAMAAFGVRLAVPALTAQLWQGSSEINLNLSLEFHTESDPVADVQTPILNLNRLVMPSINSSTGLLQSPGPSLNFNQLTTIAKNAGTSLANTASNITGIGKAAPQSSSMNNTSTSTNSGVGTAVNQSSTQNPQLGTSQYWKTQIANQISIRIGRYMFFDSVVITDVQQTFMSNIDAITGLPHHATVDITFRPLFMLTVEDLASVFTSNSAPGQPAGPNMQTTTNLGSSISKGLSSVGNSLTSLMPGTSFAYVPPQYRGINGL